MEDFICLSQGVLGGSLSANRYAGLCIDEQIKLSQ